MNLPLSSRISFALALLVLSLIALVALPLFAARMNAPDSSTTLVISQFQVAGSTAADEFIELKEVGNVAINLDGYRLVYRSATGNTDFTLVDWNSRVVLQPNCFYLVAESPAYTGVVTPDITYAGGKLSGSAGGLAIRYGPENNGTIIDSVGYGSTVTNTFIELSPTVAPPPSQSDARKENGSVDTDDNALDFEILNPSIPHNTTYGNGCALTSATLELFVPVILR